MVTASESHHVRVAPLRWRPSAARRRERPRSAGVRPEYFPVLGNVVGRSVETLDQAVAEATKAKVALCVVQTAVHMGATASRGSARREYLSRAAHLLEALGTLRTLNRAQPLWTTTAVQLVQFAMACHAPAMLAMVLAELRTPAGRLPPALTRLVVDGGEIPALVRLTLRARERDPVALMRTFVEFGADPNECDTKGHTALHYAAHHAPVAVVRELVRLGASLKSKTASGTNPLMVASGCSRAEACEVLIAAGSSVSVANTEGLTALMLACSRNGHKDDASAEDVLRTVQCLLDAGCPLNARTKAGRRALHYAVHSGNVDIVALLLAHKARVNDAAANGHQPLDCVFAAVEAEVGGVPLVTMLLEAGARFGDVKAACEAVGKLLPKHADIVEALVRHRSFDRATPAARGYIMNRAVMEGLLPTVKLLLAHGFPLDVAPGQHGATYFAVLHNRLDVLRLLLDGGANADGSSGTGQTPLCVAAGEGNVNAMALLLEHGASVGQRSEGGSTPLHKAAEALSVDACRLLLSRPGTVVDARDEEGKTPLVVALRSRSIRRGEAGISQLCEVMDLLLKAGADVEATAKHEAMTPLCIVIASYPAWGKHTIRGVELLVRHGANVNAQIEGIRGGRQNILDYFIEMDNDLQLVQVLLAAGARLSDPGKVCQQMLRSTLMLNMPSAWEEAPVLLSSGALDGADPADLRRLSDALARRNGTRPLH